MELANGCEHEQLAGGRFRDVFCMCSLFQVRRQVDAEEFHRGDDRDGNVVNADVAVQIGAV